MITQPTSQDYGGTLSVRQLEELVSGPRLACGDNVAFLNFLKRLNSVSKILKGNVEQEGSVATNLKCIACEHLPYDLVGKLWTMSKYNFKSSSFGKMFKPIDTLRSKLVKVKDKMPRKKLSNLVYGIPCGSQGCAAIYIGETKQSLLALISIVTRDPTRSRSSVPTLQGNSSFLQQHGRGDTRLRRGLGSTRHKGGHMGKGGAAFTQPQRGVPF